MPLYVSAKNPFDYENFPEHVKQVVQGSTTCQILISQMEAGDYRRPIYTRTYKKMLDLTLIM